MEKDTMCLVGHDSDDDGFAALMIVIVIAVIVVCAVVALVVYGGAFIGGFHSLKNYFISLKHNVWDSNFGTTALSDAA